MKGENINMKGSIGYSSQNNDILPDDLAQQLEEVKNERKSLIIKELDKEDEDLSIK